MKHVFTRMIHSPIMLMVFSFSLFVFSWPLVVYLFSDDYIRRDIDWGFTSGFYTLSLAFCYPFWRVLAFHPHGLKSYNQWLQQTPWQTPQSLPFGPFGPAWFDLLVIGLLGTLASFVHGHDPRWGIQCALLGFTLPLLHCVGSGVWYWVYILLLPFLFIPHFNFSISLGIQAVWVLVLTIAAHRHLLRYPWREQSWTRHPLDQLSEDDERLLHWPYDQLFLAKKPLVIVESQGKVYLRIDALPPLWTIILSGAWFLYLSPLLFLALGFFTAPSRLDALDMPVNQNGIFCFFAFVTTGGAALIRFLSYRWGRSAPISLFGRFATGRLIIPGYDMVYLAPLLTLFTGWLMWRVMIDSWMPMSWFLALYFGVVTTVAAYAPPTLTEWRLLGQYRSVRPVTNKDIKSSKMVRQDLSQGMELI